MKSFSFQMNTCDNILIDRNSVWESAHEVKTRIIDMDDTYLANLYDYLKHRSEQVLHKKFDENLMEIIEEIMEERGLKEEFITTAQIPYKNPKGKWEIWDFDTGYLMELEK